MRKALHRKPELRFAGFADAWEQRKLGEKTEFVTGKSFSQELSDNGIYCVMDMGTVSQEGNRIETKKTNIQRDVLKQGDLIMPKDDIGGGLIIGRTAYIPSDNQYVLGDHVYRLRFDNDNGLFIHYQVNSDYVRKQVMPLVTGSAQLGLNSKNIQGVTISLPSYKEQMQIGEFFANLDNLITLHQRKLQALKNIKKSMLQVLFPMKGKQVPNVRFSGFSEPWNQYKMGELYKERKEPGDKTLQILSVSIHSGVSDGELSEDELGKTVRRSEDKSAYKHVYSGDLIFNMMRAWQGAIGVAKNEGMISPAYISAIPNEKVFPPFMDYALRRNEPISQINDLSYGVTDFRKRLYWDSFIKVTCYLPTVNEQIIIWKYLKSIDDTIQSNTRAIEVYSKFKKALLQKMFV